MPTEKVSSYYRARYYDPNTGRFLNEDPLRFRAGDDFYPYVSNSSPNLTDPFGLQSPGTAPATETTKAAVDAYLARLEAQLSAEAAAAAAASRATLMSAARLLGNIVGTVGIVLTSPTPAGETPEQMEELKIGRAHV